MTILRHLWEHEPSQLYDRIELPVLLVACRGSELPPRKREAVEEATNALPRVRTHWMSADHDVHAQRPREVAALLRTCVEDGFFG